LAGFAFVYYDFPHKEKIFNVFLLTFFVPVTAVIMPNYLLISKLGLMNSVWGVMLPQMADGMGIFLMRQAMRTIPKGLIEAAKLDKAKAFTVLMKIVIPLITPSVTAIGIVFFIDSWNEYFWPLLILTDKTSYTLPLALQMFISAEGGSKWGSAMAVATLASLPPLILYLMCQRFIMNTFMQSGMKG
jgi:sn-glycerol 3-phosphate transport system permease protein